MSLRVQRGTGSRINKLLFGFVAVFALIAQPMYGLVASQVAEAASLDVCTSGCVYTTIQSAINAAAAGDTITVADGTYNESLSITKKVILVGAAGATIQGQPASEYAINITGGSAVNETSISGFNIVAAAGKVGLKVDKTGVDKLNVANNNFSGGSRLAYIGGATNSTFTNNTFNVAGNTVASVYVAGVPSNGAGAVTPSANIWSGNTFTGATTQLAFGSEASNSQFTNNNLTGLDVSIKDKIVEFLGTNNTASGNTFNPAQPAISVYGSGVDYKGTFTTFGKTLSVTGAGATIVLESDISTNTQVTINQSNVTFNGNNKTLKNNRDNSVKDNSNNSAIGIQANGVTVNNLTIDGTDGVWMHGINVYEAKNVAINNTTLKNNSNAGLIVGKDSEVKINNITTSGNGWYGINVDKKTGTSATLTVNGVSTHDEDATAHIYIDDRDATGNTVNDPGLQYVRYWKNAGYQYLLDRSKPTVTSTIAAENPTEFSVHATDDQRLIRIDYSIWNKDRTVQIGVWGQNIDGHVKVFDKTLTEYRVGTTAAYKALTELPDGEYQLNVTVGDVRGKSTNATVAYFKIGDFTAPTASITVESPAGTGSLHRNIVKVTGSVGATDTDIKSHWIEIKNPDGSLSYSYNMNTTSLTHSFDLDTSKGDGEYRIRYVATDRDGNRSDRSGDTIRVIMVDNSAPVITDIATTATPTSITVSGKTDSPDRPVFVTLDGDTQEATVDPTTGEWTITFTGLTSNAPYPFTVRSADAVDNVFESSAPARTAVAVVVVPGGRQVTAEVPVVDDEDDDQTNFIAFLPATFGGLGVNDDAAVTPLLPATPAADGDDEPDVLGAEDTKANWSVVNAALAGFIAILAVVALAGIRRNEADNNTGARLFMIVPAAAAVIAFFVIEDIGGSMGWFNVWTWLFAGILVVQAILATLTTRTAND